MGDDVRQSGFAQPGRAVDDHVVKRLAAHPGRLHGDAQVFPHLGLPDEVAEPSRPQANVLFAVIALGHGGDRPCFGVCRAVRPLCGGHDGILGAAPPGGQPRGPRGCVIIAPMPKPRAVAGVRREFSRVPS